MARSFEKNVPDDTGPKSKINIWLVNDDPAQLLVQKRLLGRFASEVTDFGSALEAFAQAQKSEGSPAFLVSDINMPGMSGAELASLWHELHPDAKVLLLSASVLSPEMRKTVERLPSSSVKTLSPYRLGELSKAAQEWFGGGAAEVEPAEQANLPYPKTKSNSSEYLDSNSMEKLFQLGGKSFLEKAIGRFVESVIDKTAKIELAAAANDRRTLHEVSHGLKGSGGILGATPLMEACDALERATSPEHSVEPVQELVATVQRVASATLQEAKSLLESSP